PESPSDGGFVPRRTPPAREGLRSSHARDPQCRSSEALEQTRVADLALSHQAGVRGGGGEAAHSDPTSEHRDLQTRRSIPPLSTGGRSRCGCVSSLFSVWSLPVRVLLVVICFARESRLRTSWRW